MEKAVASIMLLGLVIVTCAYQIGGDFFWPVHDVGQLLLPVGFLVLVKNSLLLSCVGWLWFSGALNALIASMLFDVTVMGLNQKISIAFLCLGAAIFGIVYALDRHKHRKAHEAMCKRTARKQYKEIRKRIEDMEARVDKFDAEKYDNALDNFLNQLTK